MDGLCAAILRAAVAFALRLFALNEELCDDGLEGDVISSKALDFGCEALGLIVTPALTKPLAYGVIGDIECFFGFHHGEAVVFNGWQVPVC